MISGIYQIVNDLNGKKYIGSSLDIQQRWAGHKTVLRKGCHPNRHLQSAWVRYGEFSFTFSVLEEVARKEDLVIVEQRYMDQYRVLDPNVGYNLCPNARSSLGVKRSPETKARIRQANLGKVASPETRMKMSAVRVGKPHTWKHWKDAEYVNLTCVVCGHGFKREARLERFRKKFRKSGPVCGVRCRNVLVARIKHHGHSCSQRSVCPDV